MFKRVIHVEQHEESAMTVVEKKAKTMIKQNAIEQSVERWRQKTLHGKYVPRSKEAVVHQTRSTHISSEGVQG